MVFDSTRQPGFFFHHETDEIDDPQQEPDKDHDENGLGNPVNDGFKGYFKNFKLQSGWKTQFINSDDRNKSNQEDFQGIQQEFDK